MSARSRLMLVATAVLVAAGAPSAHAAVQSRTIAVPDVRARTVEVQFLRENGARGASYSFMARNRTSQRRVIRARYVSAHPHVFVVTGDAQTTTRKPVTHKDLTSQRGLAISVPPHEVATFSVAFDAADTSATPEQADGRLILTSERPRHHRVVGAPLVLRLSGVRAEERDLRVSPSDVTLPLTLATPHPHWTSTVRDMLEIEARDKDAKAYVELRGPGAAALSENTKTIRTVLRRDDGKSVQVTLRVKSRGDNVAQLVMPFGDVQIDEPGRYTGTLPVGPGPRAPSVTLNVDAKLWLGWAVLIVVIGVFLGRMVPPFLSRERRKRRGRDAIADAIRIYGSNRRGRAEAASYDLDWLIAPGRWQLRGVFTRPQDEPARLLRELNEESNKAAVDQAIKDARALRTRVERWTQVEGAARRLLDELDGQGAQRGRVLRTHWYRSGPLMPRGYIGPWAFIILGAVVIGLEAWLLDFATLVWLLATLPPALTVAIAGDTLAERRRARKPERIPELVRNDAEAVVLALSTFAEQVSVANEAQPSGDEKKQLDKLVAACVRTDRERRAVQLAFEVWRRQDRLDGRRMHRQDIAKRKTLELDVLWPPPPSTNPPEVPEPAARDLKAFKDLTRTLRKASDDLKALQRSYPPFGGPSRQWIRAIRDTLSLDRISAYTLWAIEAFFRSLVRLVAVVIRSVLGLVVGIVRRVIGAGRGWIAVASVLSGLLTLCVPVLVYVLTLYSDTWGSPLDVLTAFAAGFGGKLALDFGSTLKMPSFGPKEKSGTGGEQGGGVEEAEPPPTPEPQNGDAREQVPALSS